MKSYIIVLGAQAPPRERIQALLNEMPEVTYWYACISKSIFCTSSLTAFEIADAVFKKFGNKFRFYITEVLADNSQGWLPKKAWHLIQNPDNPALEDTDDS
jgi:hypothetical protein